MVKTSAITPPASRTASTAFSAEPPVVVTSLDIGEDAFAGELAHRLEGIGILVVLQQAATGSAPQAASQSTGTAAGNRAVVLVAGKKTLHDNRAAAMWSAITR